MMHQSREHLFTKDFWGNSRNSRGKSVKVAGTERYVKTKKEISQQVLIHKGAAGKTRNMRKQVLNS